MGYFDKSKGIYLMNIHKSCEASTYLFNKLVNFF